MKTELLHLEPSNIKSFIYHCVCGNGRMVIRHKDNKVVLDNGKYIAKKDGRYVTPERLPQLKQIEIMNRMIQKYERFEYEGFLYHSPESNIWTKEEI